MDEDMATLMLKMLLFLIVGCEICSFASLLLLLLLGFFLEFVFFVKCTVMFSVPLTRACRDSRKMAA